MDLSPQLHAFVRSVRAGSFSAAAREAGTTPSAFSKQVARLEQKLGVPLVMRSGQGLQPTPEGEALFARVQRAFDDITDACEEAARATGPRGQVRMSAPVELGHAWLVPRLPALHRAHPQIAVTLELADRFVDLHAEQFDLALRVGGEGDGRLVQRRLGRLRRCFCATPAYLKAHGVPRTPEALAGHRLLAILRAGRRVAWELPGGGRLTPQGPVASDSNEALRQLALAGMGIAWLPDVTIAADLKRGALRQLFADTPEEPGLPIQLVFPQSRLLAPRVRAVVDFLVAAARSTMSA
ncbi:LysR family transcriptional regulator [Nannocystis sp. SCPEA4]|uniref:LysR family transcriptional regulator n=1 Tax=Nannocystis sp. SCPEA4 TaxID=2996787 RepID=UPI0022716D98|nr:LysR family transcriptional regulator [Nannocystis sp. SCPEA4]